MRHLTTFDEVLEALGGFEGISKITGARTTAISNWRARGEKFPARHYVVITAALKRRKKLPRRSLFTFTQRQSNGKAA